MFEKTKSEGNRGLRLAMKLLSEIAAEGSKVVLSTPPSWFESQADHLRYFQFILLKLKL